MGPRGIPSAGRVAPAILEYTAPRLPEGYAAFTRESLARTVNGIPDEFKI